MGSFYSTCSISNMTLTHQKTSVLLLSPNHNISFEDHLGMIVSNDRCQTFFSPFGFPIHGEYDDYGYITNIKRDRNVQMIEDYFGIGIDEVLKNIGDTRYIPKEIKNGEIYEKLGKTYFRTEILEYLQEGWESYDFLNKPDENNRLYNRFQKFLELLKSNQSNTNRRETIDNLFEKMGEGTITEDEKTMLSLLIGSNPLKEYSYISQMSKFNMFSLLPINLEFKEEILKQYCMLMSLTPLHKILIPSNYGGQETNWAEIYNLNNFINDLLVEDIKEGEFNSKEEKDILNNHKLIKRKRKINSIL